MPITILMANCSDSRSVKKDDDGLKTFDISPDGTSFVFTRTSGGKTRLFRSGVDGKDSKLLIDPATRIYNPRFSSNGKRIVFVVYSGKRNRGLFSLSK